MTLKLYVWEGVLPSYTTGMIVALAETLDEARLVVVRKHDTDAMGRVPKYSEDAYHKWLAEGRPSDDGNSVWRDIQGEPDVYENPIAFIQWGGD